jgi:Cu2+-exporting ATPase
MLVGRYLQERVLENNRRQLLACPDLDALEVRVVRDGALATQPARRVAEGDELLVVPGDLLVVPARLLTERASCSLDWVNGESAPADYTAGERVPAGAFNIGTEAIRVQALTAFADSPLEALLRAPRERGDTPLSAGLRNFSWLYVLAVLLFGIGGLVYWTLATGLLVRGLEVATAVFVVTCPCALGIAVPLARELAHARLRARGVFVRRLDLLDRALTVRRVVFDKTGTLTTGALALDDARVLQALAPADRLALGDMVSRSLHPRSLAIRRALDDARPLRFDPERRVQELTGRGLSMAQAGHSYRLGSGQWLAPFVR